MRERRLDLDEAQTEEKKQFETLRKELETLQRKFKAVESGVKSAQQELEAFQVRAVSRH